MDQIAKLKEIVDNSEEIQPQATFEEEDAQTNPEPRESYEYNTTVDTDPVRSL